MFSATYKNAGSNLQVVGFDDRILMQNFELNQSRALRLRRSEIYFDPLDQSCKFVYLLDISGK